LTGAKASSPGAIRGVAGAAGELARDREGGAVAAGAGFDLLRRWNSFCA
jgi:hypothetical protein